ncbi:MAG: PD40 domain-containing protein [Chitinophagaceae bacterium]|nr:PD40 domain-containing protein [Chitinophagaceae bacterium]
MEKYRELVLSWNAEKRKAVLYGVGADGVIITGESQWIAANELRLVLSSTNAEGKSEVSKEVFRFKDGKIEVSDTTGKLSTHMTFTPMEQPAGNLTFMSTRDGNFEMYSMDATGENLKNLSCNKATDYAFSYAKDGRLAFYSNRDGNNEIYIMDSAGKKQTNITNHPSGDRVPYFSPDGKQVLFISDRDHKSGEIYIMDADGNNVKRLTSNEYFEDAAGWSNDGKKYIFQGTERPEGYQCKSTGKW